MSSTSFALLEGALEEVNSAELLNCSVEICHSKENGNYQEVYSQESSADVVDLCMEERKSDQHRWLPVSVQSMSQDQAVSLFIEKYDGKYDSLLKSAMSCVPVADYVIKPLMDESLPDRADHAKAVDFVHNPDGSVTIMQPFIKNDSMHRWLGRGSSVTGTCLMYGFSEGLASANASSGVTTTVQINSAGHISDTTTKYYALTSVTCK